MADLRVNGATPEHRPITAFLADETNDRKSTRHVVAEVEKRNRPHGEAGMDRMERQREEVAG